MSSKSSNKTSKVNDRTLQRKKSIPVQVTDLSLFDNAYAFMKERFAEEMRRIDEQMNNFSSDLMRFYGQSTTMQTGLVPPRHDSLVSGWDILTRSPLVQGEGKEKTLKLQFDVSQFDPTEVKVKLLNDLLIVSAAHEEKTNGASVYREYNREFMLPPGTNPEQVVSSLSRDGVLTVQAPLLQPMHRKILAERD